MKARLRYKKQEGKPFCANINGYKNFPCLFEEIFGLYVNMVKLTLITQPISSAVNQEFIVVETFICKVLIYKLPLVET